MPKTRYSHFLESLHLRRVEMTELLQGDFRIYIAVCCQSHGRRVKLTPSLLYIYTVVVEARASNPSLICINSFLIMSGTGKYLYTMYVQY